MIAAPTPTAPIRYLASTAPVGNAAAAAFGVVTPNTPALEVEVGVAVRHGVVKMVDTVTGMLATVRVSRISVVHTPSSSSSSPPRPPVGNMG